MDLLILRRLVAEMDESVRGARIDRVYALPKHDIALVLGRSQAPRLWYGGDPQAPHFYRRQGRHPVPKRPPAFAMAARKLLSGRRIGSIEWKHGDRVAELVCVGDEPVRVVFELIPRRPTVLIVDGHGKVRASWQPRRGRPEIGEPYRPPRADDRPDAAAATAAQWAELENAADDDALVSGLLRTIASMSPLVAREIAATRRGAPLRDHTLEHIERAESRPTGAVIYSPVPLEALRDLPSARRFILAPFPLQHIEGSEKQPLIGTPFPSLEEAAAVFFPLRAALQARQHATSNLQRALEIGISRAHRALDAVRGDSGKLGDAGEHRRHGDLLLANPKAPRRGNTATVVDHYSDGVAVDIPIDPTRSLVENAQKYYKRARRADRSIARTAQRRQQLQTHVTALRNLLATAHSDADLETMLRAGREAVAAGIKVAPDKWVVPEAQRLSSAGEFSREEETNLTAGAPETAAPGGRRSRLGPGIEAYISSAGDEILVGRNADANERLTHKLASPHDFWLHAEGPGSHVVVRNHQRRETPDEDSLREAAALAAHFSAGRGATKVNVSWTQVRRVKKPRGGAKGQVLLKASSTVLAEPLSPEELFPQEERG